MRGSALMPHLGEGLSDPSSKALPRFDLDSYLGSAFLVGSWPIRREAVSLVLDRVGQVGVAERPFPTARRTDEAASPSHHHRAAPRAPVHLSLAVLSVDSRERSKVA